MKRILRFAAVAIIVVTFSCTLAAKVLWASCGGCGSEKSHDHSHTAKTSEEKQKITDPVCGMEVKDITKAPRVEHDGKLVYFCSDACKKTFRENNKE
ncbi:MAG: YHS domain-containing protein [Candidatus Brocadiaceae bacterium]|nr:YHS domain-containing protein [Candidatus Brocadiaceae bacterium]